MKTDPNLCPPPAPESGEGRRPSDRPSPVTALGGTERTGHPMAAEQLLPPAERRSVLRAVRWEERAPAEASGEVQARSATYPEEDLTPGASGEFDPYRYGSHMLPYEFLQDALKEPLRAPREEDLLHETLPPFAPNAVTSVAPVVVDPKKTLAKGMRLSPEQAAFLRGTDPGSDTALAAMSAAGPRTKRGRAWALLLGAGALSLALGLWVGRWERSHKERRSRVEPVTQLAAQTGVSPLPEAQPEVVAPHSDAEPPPVGGRLPAVEADQVRRAEAVAPPSVVGTPVAAPIMGARARAKSRPTATSARSAPASTTVEPALDSQRASEAPASPRIEPDDAVAQRPQGPARTSGREFQLRD